MIPTIYSKFVSLLCVVLQRVHKGYSIIMREGLEGRTWRALELFIHSVAKTLLPPPTCQKVVGATLLQHLTPRLWKFEGQKTARR